MKRVLMLLAVAFCFCLTSVAQTPSTSGQSTTTTKTSKTRTTKTSKSAASQESSTSAKSSQLTGCVSGPNPEGAYLLTNSRYRKGVEIGGNDDLKNHVGHEVKLTGTWASAKAIGETEQAEKNADNAAKSAEKSEKGERHFKVDSIAMVSDTCPATKNGASAGAAKSKSGKKSSTAAPSGSASAAPPTK